MNRVIAVLRGRWWHNTGMLLRLSCAVTFALVLSAQSYVGSTVCKTCHTEIYDRWPKTRMANVVRDPKEHPDAIIPDFSKADPLLTFTKDDIAFVYGSKWKQRYFTESGRRLLPAAGAVGYHAQYLARLPRAGTAPIGGPPFYPADNMQAAHRPALRRLPFSELQHPDQDR